MPDRPPGRPGRKLLALLVAVLGVSIAGTAWFLTRPVKSGAFVARIVPAGPGAFVLTLRGPSGETLGTWPFQDAPGPGILASFLAKVPWTPVRSDATRRQPCLAIETTRLVPAAAIRPLHDLALARCCPGMTDPADCPVDLVVREH